MQPIQQISIPTREGFLRERYLSDKKLPSLKEYLTHITYKGRLQHAEDTVQSACQEFKEESKFYILAAHISLIQGRHLTSAMTLDKLLKRAPSDLEAWAYFVYIHSIKLIESKVFPKSTVIERIGSTFHACQAIKDTLLMLLDPTPELIGKVKAHAENSSDPFVLSAYLSLVLKDSYDKRGTLIQRFCSEDYTQAPFFAASILMEMIYHNDDINALKWFKKNETFATQFPALGVIKVFLLFKLNRMSEAEEISNGLTETLPDREFLNFGFIGAEKAELYLKRLANETKFLPSHLKIFADLLFNLREIELAQVYYEKLFDAFPDDPLIHARLAFCLSIQDEINLDQLDTLLNENQEYVKSSSDSLEINQLFGRAYLYFDKPEKALVLLNKGPHTVANIDYKAKALYRLQRYKESALEFAKVIAVGSNDARVYFNMALCYLEIESYSEAIKLLYKSIETNKCYVPALFYLTKELMAKGDFEGALRYSILALHSDMDDPDQWWLKGEIETKRDNVEESAKAYEQAYRLAPYDEIIALSLARAYAALHRYKSAYEILNNVRPNDSKRYNQKMYLMILALQGLNQKEELNTILDEFLSKFKDDPKLFLLRSSMALLDGKLKAALDDLKTCLELKDDPIIRRRVLWIERLINTPGTFNECAQNVFRETADIEGLNGDLTKRRLLWHYHRLYSESPHGKMIDDNPLKISLISIMESLKEEKSFEVFKEHEAFVFDHEEYNRERQVFELAMTKDLPDAALMSLYCLIVMNRKAPRPNQELLEHYEGFKSLAKLSIIDLEYVEYKSFALPKPKKKKK
ncbi:MAG: tetratricopeptide repeat protein [Chlamydiia bacterium]|nr:tetratricopeptide repeat protein [Chlamydiia bacterium]